MQCSLAPRIACIRAGPAIAAQPDPGVRLLHAGTAASRNVPACGTGWYGENTGKVWSGGVDVLHREFMAEPWEPINHRTNIMDPNFRRAGVGAVQGPDAVYVTVVFCR